jgi:hypothetical protein
LRSMTVFSLMDSGDVSERTHAWGANRPACANQFVR